MSATNKASNAAQGLKGKGEEAVGKLTHDNSKIVHGKADQVAAKAKNKIEDAKDSLRK